MLKYSATVDYLAWTPVEVPIVLDLRLEGLSIL